MTDLLSVADEVGTPCYAYDLAEIRVNQQRLRAALPEGAGLYYSLSANPHPELLLEIRAAGVLPAVRSAGELDVAVAAGWPATDVLYTGRARTDRDLDWALRLGVRTFTVDSPAALDQVTRAAGPREHVRCLVRVNACGFVPDGADPKFVLDGPAGFAGGRAAGLHLCADAEENGVADLTERLATALGTHGMPLEQVVFSGFTPGYAALLPGRPRVAFEVDSELVGTAGTLVTAVLDVRVEGERQLVVLESGANHAGLFAGRRRRSLVPRLISRPPSGAPLDTVLIGAQETPVDVWAPPARLPRFRPGDVVAVPDTGAWGLTAGLVAFSAPALPAEVVVDSDDPDTRVVHVSRLSVTRYP